MSSLLDRMKKASVIEGAAALSKSALFKERNLIKLPVPMMNVAFSGKFDGGFGPGLHQLAGPSKHFKSNMGLVLCKAFQDTHEDGIILFYDSEFGSSQDYFATAGIDIDRVLHLPIMNLEELKFDIIKKLEDINPKTDKVLIFVDSVGNTASKKEVEDAKKESDKADMSRAKQIKSIFRMCTPYLTTKKIPMIVINHTYQTQEMYAKTVVSGGTGIEYSSNTIFVIGKRQIKEGTDLQGFEFVLNANKSRFIKEKSAIPITVTFSGGIDKFSGLLDVAVATGHVVRPNNRSYVRPFVIDETGEPESKLWKKSELNTDDFWDPILNDETFKDAVEKMYSLTSAKLFTLDATGEAIIVDHEPEEEQEEEFDVDPETGEILA